MAESSVPESLVAFARALRAAGLPVPLSAVVAWAQAAEVVAGEGTAGLYWAGRATLVHRPEDVARYDAVFAAHWLGAEPAAPAPITPVPMAFDDDDDDEPGAADDPGPGPAPDGDVLAVRYSPTEVLRHKDFAACTDAELAELRRLMAAVRLRGPLRQSRRLAPTRRRRGAPDLPRTTRAALRTGGEPLTRYHRRPGRRPRPVVLLCDVSGSMEPYARALLRFAHAAVAGRGSVHAFAVGTRLTRLTRELASHDPDEALRRAAAAVPDWSGGTRLGEALHTFNDCWGVRGLARGAVVVILSDGWDRGDPALLGDELARLRRVTHRLVWVNPLRAGAGYAPVARGMAVALPHLDAFVDGHDLASLEALAEVVAR